MAERRQDDEGTAQQAIAAALTRIEAQAPRLRFRDEWAEAAARRYIAQGIRAIRYHLQQSLPDNAPTPPTER